VTPPARVKPGARISEATRTRIEELLRKRPRASLREIALEAGTTHNTVSGIRKRLPEVGQPESYRIAGAADEQLAYDDRRNRPPAVVRATLIVTGIPGGREFRASRDFSPAVVGTEEGLLEVMQKTAQEFVKRVMPYWLAAEATQS
jgi:hypothetical protein